MKIAQHTQEPGHTHCVSYWHIPNGTDYERAQVRLAWFYDEQSAQQFADKYRNPPERAFVMIKQQYERAKRAARAI